MSKAILPVRNTGMLNPRPAGRIQPPNMLYPAFETG